MSSLSRITKTLPIKWKMRQARHLLRAGDAAGALKVLETAAARGQKVAGLQYLRGSALERAARHSEALLAYELELAAFPGNERAARQREALRKAFEIPGAQTRGLDRSWHSSIPHDFLLRLQQSLHNYTYRGVPMLKNPFDQALYPLVLWDLKPRTLFEIGSKSGGSGLWFGDLMNNFGIDGHIYSIDIVKATGVDHSRVTFLEGNGRKLGETVSETMLRSLPRPWLVIEDADHEYATSIAVLRFFDSWLQPGEYIVVEDGITSDLVNDPACNSGPHRALKEFLSDPAHRYEIDPAYCDYFGPNVTWCTNGFLKKLPQSAP